MLGLYNMQSNQADHSGSNGLGHICRKLCLAGIASLAVLSCTSTPHKVKDLETGELEVQSKGINEDIGINENDQAVIRQNQDARTALQIQRVGNLRLEQELSAENSEYTSCWEQMSSPKMGGDGQVRDLPDPEALKEVVNVKEEVGLDADGQLRVVKEEFLNETLTKEKTYNSRLRAMLKEARKARKECERKLRYKKRRLKMDQQEFGG